MHKIIIEFGDRCLEEYYQDSTKNGQSLRIYLEDNIKYTGWVNWIESIDGVETFYLREYFENGICHNENGPAFYTQNVNSDLSWDLHYSLNNEMIKQNEWLEKVKLFEYKNDFERIIK